MKKGFLSVILPDGEITFDGFVFGDTSRSKTSGEVVFQTGQVGYVESLSDPSYRDQILVLTYPLIGNYGVPDPNIRDEFGLSIHFESEKIHLNALVVGEYIDTPSHHSAVMTLNQWLLDQHVIGLHGVNTRAITELVREHGTLKGTICCCENGENKSTTSAKPAKPEIYSSYEIHGRSDTSPSVLVVDCGIKTNQLRCLLNVGLDLTVCHHSHAFADTIIKHQHFVGLFISNGPGDPKDYQHVISQLKQILFDRPNIAIFGICLGHQLLALASGLNTTKMKYGNRGHNIPCKLIGTRRTFMTSQNHGYSVDVSILPDHASCRSLFQNINDGSNEGLYWTDRKWFSVQFHPEAKSGPTDTMGLFQAFRSLIETATSIDVFTTVCKSLNVDLHLTRTPHSYRKVLVLGSGGLSIGQSGEFDYSGSQAIKAYREAGLTTILVNPNIATVQTSPGFVDKVYYVPITPEYVQQVIELEHPDCIALSFGGQTSLMCGAKLFNSGILAKHNVDVLGTTIKSIEITEDRDLFKQHVIAIGEKICESGCANSSEEALSIAKRIGFPVLVRAAFALGGLGSGFATNETELRSLLLSSFAISSQVIIDKSFRGWKELEYEIVRDCFGNIINVCNMENVDPLGVHTGESIVVAPSQTLTDADHNRLREVAFKVVSSLNIVGECNIQFAVNPLDSTEYYIIEVNARLSRSSALASKATGYPLAYVAAKLTLGLALDELKNNMTGDTSACFEPSLDYCVVKVPRWDLTKFDMVDKHIGSAMKSVGEGMAISRTFEEALQSAIRMSGIDEFGIRAGVVPCSDDELSNPTYQRILAVASGIADGRSVANISQLSGIDPWFLFAIERIVKMQLLLESTMSAEYLREAKRLGFSDRYIALCLKITHVAVRDLRIAQGIRPRIHRIDTVAAEFPCRTNYMYLTYSNDSKREQSVTESDTAIVLGSGVYKIGSSVEFDWCAVNCIRELRALGKRVIMINCNPETVSTDYDEADVLCFTEVSLECVLDVYQHYQPDLGVVISVGGQLPNNMAMDLHYAHVPVIGTQPSSIDGAENRYKFSRMLDEIHVGQPQWKELTSTESAKQWCAEKYPVLVRPSYVLSGAAMNVAYSDTDLEKYLNAATCVSRDHPVVVSKFIVGAKEIEVDAVADRGCVTIMAISEHVENAGVHSGDATLVFPAQDLTVQTKEQISASVKAIASQLNISGPFNMQFIAKDDRILVIECNLRVSRSFPFVSKTMGVNLVAHATRIMMGISDNNVSQTNMNRIGVKVAQFSFNRLPKADILLGVEMRSTGEVACFGETAPEAFMKALIASGFRVPPVGSNILLSIGGYDAKKEFRGSVLTLANSFNLFATHNTADYIATTIPRTTTPPVVTELSNADILKRIADRQISLVINITERNKMRDETMHTSFGYKMRRLAVDLGIPVLTDIKAAKMFVSGLANLFFKTVRPSIDCFTKYRLVRLPGLIDVHVHVRDMEESYKEDWSTCTQSALAGGITMICAMPNTVPPVIDQESFDATEKVANNRAYCDFGLYIGAANGNTTTSVSVSGPVAKKLYLNHTHNPSNRLSLRDTDVWLEHFRNWDSDRPICVHAEGETLAAVLYVQSFTQKRLHVCHVSTRADINLIKMAKMGVNGHLITCEAAPHHLFKLPETMSRPMGYTDDGEPQKCTFGLTVKPPLGNDDDIKALWDNMKIIDCFATDHAPHLVYEKCAKSCPGFPGLETALPLLLTAVHDGKLTMDDIVAKYHTNPKRIFGLPDQPETYIEVDPDFEWIIPPEPMFSKCDWTPFAGQKVFGVVKRVVLRGTPVYVADHRSQDIAKWMNLSPVNGKILCQEGFGQAIKVSSRRFVSAEASLPVAPPAVTRHVVFPDSKDWSQQNFVTAETLTKDKLRSIFRVADQMRTLDVPKVLSGKRVALLFMEPSTRTRVSFEVATKNLGGDVINISPTESSLQKGETLEDTISCLANIADAIVVRRSQIGIPLHNNCLMINGGDGTNEHPTQTLIDLYTIRQEIGTLGGICVVIVGDLLNGRTVHSLAKALALRNDVIIHYVSPKELMIPQNIWDYVSQRGVEQHRHDGLTDEIVAKADVLYMTRLQRERMSSMSSTEFSSAFCVTPQTLSKAKPGMRILHPLPRGNEISVDVDSDPRAAYFRQMENGIFVRMALLSLILQ